MPVIKWPHLPNAVHIDRVLSSLDEHPDEWAKSIAGMRRRDANVYDVARDAARCEATLVDSEASSFSRWGVLFALIAYEDSAHLLDSTPEEIRVLAALGHPYAVLFLPAVEVFQLCAKET